MGIGIDQLKKIQRRIAVAGGRQKHKAIKASILGGYINTLITDSINELENQFPGIAAKIVDQDNNLHNFVNIFMDGEDVRYLDGINTKLTHNCEISIVPAVAGGFK